MEDVVLKFLMSGQSVSSILIVLLYLYSYRTTKELREAQTKLLENSNSYRLELQTILKELVKEQIELHAKLNEEMKNCRLKKN